MNWLELSRCKTGDRVVFPQGHDLFPDVLIRAGATGVVVENGLNEIWCGLLIRPDAEDIRGALNHWDGCIILGSHLDSGAKVHDDPEVCTVEENERAAQWFEEAPIEVVRR